MLPTIQIKDNFLTKKEFDILNNNIDKITYKPTSTKDGNFGFRHYFKRDTDNQWLFKKIKKHFFPNTDLKIYNSSYHMRHNKKIMAHADDHAYNFILYLRGKELFHNGTGFYTNNSLHTYIGFVENRALFFDGRSNMHTDLQSLGESSFRHTINIFYDYDK